MIQAKIIADSITQEGKRITTFQLTYPRFIHGEVMTHRVFSRNAMSSRAIPVAKMIKQVWSNPAMPIHWGANQPGMQANKQLEGFKLWLAKSCWSVAAKLAASVAWVMDKCGTHKQVANRLLEPFQWMHTIVTATEWDNFYELRCHPDAQPEFQALATVMRSQHNQSKPIPLAEGEWHTPYVTKHTGDNTLDCKVSAARCARVSYLTHEGKEPSVAEDLALFNRLAGMRPLHASPLEHQATPGHVCTGNFVGWTQYRKLWEPTV